MAVTAVISCYDVLLMAIHDPNPVDFICNHRETDLLIGEYAAQCSGTVTRFNGKKWNLKPKNIVTPGEFINLDDYPPEYTGTYEKKGQTKRTTQKTAISSCWNFRGSFTRESQHALLIILQGMDTCGKDGTIRRVMEGVNVQGCDVFSFKVPTADELSRDFLWRAHKAVPSKGKIGIFNRSHYEDVLVVRVHNLVPEQAWIAALSADQRF